MGNLGRASPLVGPVDTVVAFIRAPPLHGDPDSLNAPHQGKPGSGGGGQTQLVWSIRGGEPPGDGVGCENMHTYRSVSEFKVLDELPTQCVLVDWTPGERRMIWANRAILEVFGMTLTAFTKLDMNRCQPGATECLQKMFESVQLQRRAVCEPQTIGFNQELCVVIKHFQPIETAFPEIGEARVLMLCTVASDEANALPARDEEGETTGLGFGCVDVSAGAEIIMMTFDLDTSSVLYENQQARDFYQNKLQMGRRSLSDILETCVLEDGRTKVDILALIWSMTGPDARVEFTCKKKTRSCSTGDDDDQAVWHRLVFLPMGGAEGTDASQIVLHEYDETQLVLARRLLANPKVSLNPQPASLNHQDVRSSLRTSDARAFSASSRGVWRGWEAFESLNLISTPCWVVDFSPSPQTESVLWANDAVCAVLQVDSLETALAQIDMDGGNSAAWQRERLNMYERIQVQKQRLDQQRTVYPGGRKLHFLWRCQPCCILEPGASEPRVVTLIEWLPPEADHEPKADELPSKAAGEVLRHMPSLSSIFDMDKEQCPAVFMCVQSQAFYDGYQSLGVQNSADSDASEVSDAAAHATLTIDVLFRSCLWADAEQRSQKVAQVRSLKVGDPEVTCLVRKRHPDEADRGESSWHKMVFIPIFNPLSDSASLAILVNEFDITIETRVRADLTLAVQAQKHLKDFVANISHELQTPLNGILGLTDTLLADESSKQSKTLAMIKSCGLRLKELVKNIIQVAEIEDGLTLKWGRIEVRHLVEQTCERMQSKAAAGVTLRTEVPDDLPTLEGDALRLQQVLRNLLSNAFKFTSAGSITIAANATTLSGQLELSVRDTGCGIPADQIDDVFNAWSMADVSPTRSHTGVGLGLCIVKEVVQAHKGDVSVESHTGPENHGTVIKVTLPLRRAMSGSAKRLDVSAVGNATRKTMDGMGDSTKSLDVSGGAGLAGIRARTGGTEAGDVASLSSLTRRRSREILPMPTGDLSNMRSNMMGMINFFRAGMHDEMGAASNYAACESVDSATQTDIANGDRSQMDAHVQNRSVCDGESASEQVPGRQSKESSEAFATTLDESMDSASRAAVVWNADEVAGMVEGVTGAVRQGIEAWEQQHPESGVLPQRHHSEVFGRCEVLSVDDNMLNHMVVENALAPRGYVVTTVMSGEEALELLKRRKYLPDCMLVDYMMAEMNGLQLTKLIRQYFPSNSLPVIIVSGKGLETDIDAGLHSGANDYLVKPYDVSDLKGKIKQQLRLKQHFLIEVQKQLCERPGIIDFPFSRNRSRGAHALSSLDDGLVICCDICHLLQLAHSMPSEDFARMINELLDAFDRVVSEEQVSRIVEESYVVIVGTGTGRSRARASNTTPSIPKAAVPTESRDKVLRIMTRMLDEAKGIVVTVNNEEIRPQVRIGLAFGDVIMAKVGLKVNHYTVFGPAVWEACGLASDTPPQCAQLSEQAAELIGYDKVEKGAERARRAGVGVTTTFIAKIGEYSKAKKWWSTVASMGHTDTDGQQEEDWEKKRKTLQLTGSLLWKSFKRGVVSDSDEEPAHSDCAECAALMEELETLHCELRDLRELRSEHRTPSRHACSESRASSSTSYTGAGTHGGASEVPEGTCAACAMYVCDIENLETQLREMEAKLQKATEVPPIAGLPVAIVDQPNQRRESAAASAAVGHKERKYTILSVDDDEANQAVIMGVLEPNGFKVVECMNGLDALSYLRGCKRLPDLILLDYMMPQMSGIDVTEKIRETHTQLQLPIIMVSAKSSAHNITAGLETGCNDYITKPIDCKELLARIATQLQMKELVAAELNKSADAKLLRTLFPHDTLQQLLCGSVIQPTEHHNITVLCAAIVDFDALEDEAEPQEVMSTLHQLFSAFDVLCDKFAGLKVQGDRDVFTVVLNADGRSTIHPEHGVQLAEQMLQHCHRLHFPSAPSNRLQVRIGLDSGPASSGILGARSPRPCFLGAAMTTAMRLASCGFAMNVHMSDRCVAKIDNRWELSAVKGGSLQEVTYVLTDWDRIQPKSPQSSNAPRRKADPEPQIVPLDRDQSPNRLSAEAGAEKPRGNVSTRQNPALDVVSQTDSGQDSRAEGERCQFCLSAEEREQAAKAALDVLVEHHRLLVRSFQVLAAQGEQSLSEAENLLPSMRESSQTPFLSTTPASQRQVTMDDGNEHQQGREGRERAEPRLPGAESAHPPNGGAEGAVGGRSSAYPTTHTETATRRLVPSPNAPPLQPAGPFRPPSNMAGSPVAADASAGAVPSWSERPLPGRHRGVFQTALRRSSHDGDGEGRSRARRDAKSKEAEERSSEVPWWLQG